MGLRSSAVGSARANGFLLQVRLHFSQNVFLQLEQRVFFRQILSPSSSRSNSGHGSKGSARARLGRVAQRINATLGVRHARIVEHGITWQWRQHHVALAGSPACGLSANRADSHMPGGHEVIVWGCRACEGEQARRGTLATPTLRRLPPLVQHALLVRMRKSVVFPTCAANNSCLHQPRILAHRRTFPDQETLATNIFCLPTRFARVGFRRQ